MNVENSETRQPLIVVIGATGFIGRHLVSELLSKTPYRIRAVARNTQKLEPVHERLEVRSGDVSSEDSMRECLSGATCVFFFAHKLETKKDDLIAQEKKMATAFAQTAKKMGVRRVIYLSGLGQDTDTLSKHLTSRHHTGDIFRQYLPEVIELRASIIVGPGSASFEIVRYLVQTFPLLLLPREGKTRTQPIALTDVVHYLLESVTLPITKSEIVEIGGPEVMNYHILLRRYASYINKKRWIVCTPLLSLWLASWLLYWLTPKHIGQIGRHMVESFQNEMIVTNQKATHLFPDITPQPIEKSFF
jgi:uncharacterized protein YbjT (DUF2867 family)